MHSQPTSPSPIQGAFVPFHDRSTLQSMSARRSVYDVHQSYNQQALREFIPMPFRHRVEETTTVRSIRQNTSSISHFIGMFGKLTHNEEMAADPSTFFYDAHLHSSSPLAPSSIHHDMIDWTREVTLNASTLPVWEDPKPTRFESFHNPVDLSLGEETLEGNCRGIRRRKRTSEQRQLQFVPRPSRIRPQRAGEEMKIEEPRKRRKRCNES
ncbi:hypothetical protein DFH28DRAFT_963846 [Melampsora americana]|nr:hypothetical protein DFH28DRAFT_963846 [Melampsora americana]